MFKLLLFFVFTLFSADLAKANTEIGVQFGGLGDNKVLSVDMGEDGNIYVLASTYGSSPLYVGDNAVHTIDVSKSKYVIARLDSLGNVLSLKQITHDLDKYDLTNIAVHRSNYYITAYNSSNDLSMLVRVDSASMDTMQTSPWYSTYINKVQIVDDKIYFVVNARVGRIDIQPIDRFCCLDMDLSQNFITSTSIPGDNHLEYQNNGEGRMERVGFYIKDYFLIDNELWLCGHFTGERPIALGNNKTLVVDKDAYTTKHMSYFSRYVRSGFYIKYTISENSLICKLAKVIYQEQDNDVSVHSLTPEEDQLRLIVHCQNSSNSDSTSSLIVSADTLKGIDGVKLLGISSICVIPDNNIYQAESYKYIDSSNAKYFQFLNKELIINEGSLSVWDNPKSQLEPIVTNSSLLYSNGLHVENNTIFAFGTFENKVTFNSRTFISGGSYDGALVFFKFPDHFAAVDKIPLPDDKLKISEVIEDESHVSVFNCLGELIKEWSGNSYGLETLPKGNYFVIVSNKDKNYKFKINI